MHIKGGKIFCIGLNKTGTTSLHKAFEIIGFKSVHYVCEKGNIKKIIKENNEMERKLLSGIDEYDSYLDWNNADTNNLFKKFDHQYPNSKFILNTRKLEDWLNSREKHVKKIPDLKILQKKYPDNTWYNLDKKAWTKVYNSHQSEVYNYFKDREGDLLVFDITKGDGWNKLCSFLSVPIPNVPFPYHNKSNKSLLKLFINRIKKLKT